MKEAVYKAKELMAREMANANSLCSDQLTELSNLFESEGLTLTDQHFINFMNDKSIQQHREDFFSPGYVYGLLLEIAEKDMVKVGIKSEKMRKQLIKAATTFLVDGFAKSQQRIDQELWKSQFELTDFTFPNGRPTVSETGKARIEAKYTASIDTDEERTFIQLFAEFLTSFEKLESHCKDNGRGLWLQNVEIDEAVYTRTPEGFKVNMHAFLKEKRNL